ncbi:MAG: replication-associated recombination protein A [Bacteroidetes bacterium]|nr:replication-associated recombination protein A [Bacteroidota bacterium]
MENLQKPLAERMRPKTLDNYIGQKHLLHENGPLQNISAKTLFSIIFWGPPGVGKTTLAQLIAKAAQVQFVAVSAIQSNVKELRSIIETAKKLGKLVVFIDEIHRFNKSQQDALLGAVEKGLVILIGATTENPSFEVNRALLSRCQVYQLNYLSNDELLQLAKNAITTDHILSKKEWVLKETEALLRFSGGDARKLLNILEILEANNTTNRTVIITNQFVANLLQSNYGNYDKAGDTHYDVISAFIKSVRGSDADAALFWLAKMLIAGEDIKFIARRLIILASEDIGLANPTALVMANNCFQAINVIGMPEARIILSQTTIYLATSAKSNSAYLAIDAAMKAANDHLNASVPSHLKNAPTQLMKDLNYGADYQYPHDYDGNFVTQAYLPKELASARFYNPGKNKREHDINSWLLNIKARK